MPVHMQTLHMVGGLGETSYASNSLIQREGVLKTQPILEEAIMNVYGNDLSSCFRLADLGCSSGPNALLVASNIIAIVDAISHTLNRDPPALQFFLNDLFGNDFNSIFKALPDLYKRMEQEKGPRSRPCFFNATLGSFYGRVYPSNSINFFHSSFGQHFLSQPPKGLKKEGEEVNKGNTYFTSTTPPAVYNAYLKQFKEDFNVFLKSRSEELVPNGGMVLVFFGRDAKDETKSMITPWALVGIVLNDMVLENIVEEAKLDSFNFPIYAPTIDEVKETIEAEGSFSLERMELIKYGWEAGLITNNSNDDGELLVDEGTKGEYIAKYVRAITEPLLKAHFGESIMDPLFIRYKNKVAKLLEVQTLGHSILAMFMTKKCLN
ncbi:salicylate carboxymethyltransferase-like [Arachis ipaensis]|uniref:Salicylate carboxymethyltransferase n=2 Tax=Arachis hypogaea TaxID=3818 RepID=A0A6B9VDE0_ARAHY|nr:salicylate carboxymethyltransferase-like [Arachis ipaensis]XP_025676901.1 salicylate carboxymethyltransferase-like [Arachis hypogaea]QHN78691.1 Salicylate carboxymethyltransferase [Arachis hypogaea]